RLHRGAGAGRRRRRAGGDHARAWIRGAEPVRWITLCISAVCRGGRESGLHRLHRLRATGEEVSVGSTRFHRRSGGGGGVRGSPAGAPPPPPKEKTLSAPDEHKGW